MKKIISYILLVPVVLMFSCTGLMDDMNNDPKSITSERMVADGVLYSQHIVSMQKNLYNLTTSWQYQVQQNLNADVFAGYTMHPGSFGTATTNDNYNWNHGWNGWAFTVAQTTLTQFLSLKSDTKDGTEKDDFYAYGLILKVMTALPLVDGFGPFPYLDYGVGASPKFDNVDAIYLQGFIPELTSAINTLKSHIGTDTENRVRDSGADLSSLQGDITSWVKLANTLKLRLALRISNKDEAAARPIIQECMDETNGFLETDFSINVRDNNLLNPFAFISVAWTDCVMSADMQSFLVGFNDPRLSAYFVPATDASVTDAGAEYAGVRAGVALTQDKGAYAGYSKLNVSDNFKLVSGAESFFLRAEAALRGLGGLGAGQAQQYYEDGVRASFAANGLTEGSASDYLASTTTPADYIDYSAAENNYALATTITPQWDAGNGLEQIITQKWIANFPQGAEAWAEFRRTGFPQLIIPKNMETSSNFDGTIGAGQFLKRMPYPSNIIEISPDAASAAIVNYLGGADNGGTALWWDVN